MRSRPIAVAVLAAALAACTGGGGGGPTTSIPPTPRPAPSPAPTPTPTPPPTTPADDPEPPPSPRGALTVGDYAKGIDRIPLNAVKLTNRQIARMYAIIEPEGRQPNNTLRYPDTRRTPHGDSVMAVACHSYITACDNPYGDNTPYLFRLGVLIRNEEHLQMERVVANLPPTIKIVSVSYGGETPAALRGANLQFASIEAAGNENRDTIAPPGLQDNEGLRNTRAAVAAGKMLFAAGYDPEKAAEGSV